MATLLRNSFVHLSVITNAFSRLQLQHSPSNAIFHHSFQPRSFTQMHPSLSKNVTGADVTTSKRARNRPSPKTTNDTDTPPSIGRLSLPTQVVGKKLKPRKFPRPQSRHKWTYEEDILLYRLVEEDKDIYDIYVNHFPYRSHAAVSRRSGFAFKTAQAHERQVREGVREGEVDIGKSVAGTEGAVPLGKVFTSLSSSIRAERDENTSDDANQHYTCRRAKTRRGKWTPEEELLLEKLVDMYRHLPEPAIWNTISGRSIAGSPPLLRAGASCSRRWIRLHPSPLLQTGRWTKEEDLLLQEAIWDQLERKYQVAVDVLVGKPATNELNLGQWPPELKQLPSHSQAGLPVLKIASRRLGMLNWLLIGEKVGTRSYSDCRDHFYKMYHNGNRGPWSGEELRRLEEGQEMFGRDYWKIAEHVETRGPRQVTDLICSLERRKKRQKASAGATNSKE